MNRQLDIKSEVKTLTDAGALTLVSRMTDGDETPASDEATTAELPNAWCTELTVADSNGATRTVFVGVRHGVCSAYARAGRARGEASLARAEELAKRAFLSRASDLCAGGCGAGTSDDPIAFNVVNVAILPLFRVCGLDVRRELLRDQRTAFGAINARNDPIAVETEGKNGSPRTVCVKPHFMMFSCGEDDLGFGLSGGAALAADMQKKINDAGLSELRLRVDGFLGRTDDSAAQKVVRRLLADVERLLADAARRFGTPDLREAASRLTLLAYLIGDVPSFNCRTGCDGTCRNDVEAKFLATLAALKRPLPDPGAPLSPELMRLRRDIMRQSGNRELREHWIR